MTVKSNVLEENTKGIVFDIKLRRVSISLTILGVIDGIYLTWIKLSNTSAYCAGIGDCDTVNFSPYAEIAGIPVALLGTGAYLVILLLLLYETKTAFMREYAPMGVFGLSLIGVLFSAYLTYVEIVILRAICPYCVLSAVLLVLLLCVGTYRVMREQQDDN
jgi:uncharacterized membrane protein